MLLVSPSQKDFVLVFREAKPRRLQKDPLPPNSPRNQSYPQILL